MSGRSIDESRGILAGEASHQTATQHEPGEVAPYALTPTVAGQDPSYYGMPVLKAPVWIWSVPAYLYTGGVAGAAMTLGAAAQLFGGTGLGRLAHRCRWIGAAGGMLSTVFLIHDLGKPVRFLYMLRVFRPSSPMSVGSWVLTFFGSSAGLSAILAGSKGVLGRFGDGAAVSAGLLGMPLASYTSVLLSNSAVPVWFEARRTMPFLFIGSGVSAAASLLDMTRLTDREERTVTIFAICGGLLEFAGMAAVEKETGVVPRVGRPFEQGFSGALWKTAKVLSAASLILSLIPGKSRPMRRVTGVTGSLASLFIRFAIFHAGKQSAQDPQATFHLQRS